MDKFVKNCFNLKLHFETKEKLEEMILHVAHYSGFPTGVSANQILNDILYNHQIHLIF